MHQCKQLSRQKGVFDKFIEVFEETAPTFFDLEE